MNALLALSRAIDALNERVGKTISWLILIAVIISSGNALIRFTFDTSSNAWLEIQWYLFATVFMLCAGYTLKNNEHVRIDVVVGRFSHRTIAWIDILGTIVFLFPFIAINLYYGVPYFLLSLRTLEMSGNAGGLIMWPPKLMIPLGFILLGLQGVSELIKRVAFLQGLVPDPNEKVGHHAPVGVE